MTYTNIEERFNWTVPALVYLGDDDYVNDPSPR